MSFDESRWIDQSRRVAATQSLRKLVTELSQNVWDVQFHYTDKTPIPWGMLEERDQNNQSLYRQLVTSPSAHRGLPEQLRETAQWIKDHPVVDTYKEGVALHARLETAIAEARAAGSFTTPAQVRTPQR